MENQWYISKYNISCLFRHCKSGKINLLTIKKVLFKINFYNFLYFFISKQRRYHKDRRVTFNLLIHFSIRMEPNVYVSQHYLEGNIDYFI